MLAKFFKKKPKPIPQTSLEAFDILSLSSDLSEIGDILFHFKQLIDIKRSILTSHALSNSKIPDNQQFIDDLDALFNKLQEAVESTKPYHSLYGDVCKLKEGLGVILRYYQFQMRVDQPIASANLERTRSQLPEIATHSLLDDKDSSILTKYTINFSAWAIMAKDIETISTIVLNPFLADHSNEPKFSYLQ